MLSCFVLQAAAGGDEGLAVLLVLFVQQAAEAVLLACDLELAFAVGHRALALTQCKSTSSFSCCCLSATLMSCPN